MKRLLRVLALLVLVLLLGAAWLVATSVGSRFAMARVQDIVPGLSYEKASGTWLRGMQFDQLQFQNGETEIIARDLRWRWTLSCVFERVLCVDDAVVGELDIKLPVADAKEEAANAPGLSDVVLPFGLKIDLLAVHSLHYVQAEVDLRVTDAQASLSMVESAVVVNALDFDWQYDAMGGQFSLRGELETTGDYPVSLNAQLDTDAGRVGELSVPASSLRLKLSESLAQLRAEAVLDGLADAKLDARVEPFVQPLPLNAVLVVDEARWPLLGDASVEIAPFRLSVSGDLETLETEANGVVITDQLDAVTLALRGELAPLRGFENGVFEIGALNGRANGTLGVLWQDGLAVSVETIATELDIGRAVPALDGEIGGRVSASIRTVPELDNALQIDDMDLELGGTLQNRPVLARGQVSLIGGELMVKDPGLTLGVGDNRAVIRGRAGETLDLASTLDIVDFSHLLPTLAGSASGTVTISGVRERPTLQAALDARDIVSGATRVQSLTVRADVREGAEVDSTADISWQGLEASSQQIGVGALTLSGVRAAHTVQLDIDGELARASVALSGALTSAVTAVPGGAKGADNWNGSLGESWLASAGHRWQVEHPVSLAYSAGGLTVEAHCWQSAPASVCLNNAATLAATGQASVGINSVPVSWVNALLPAQTALSGIVDGVVDATWVSGAVPAIKSVLRAADLNIKLPNAAGEPVSVALGSLDLEVAPVGGAQGRDDLRVLIGTEGGALGRADITVQLPLDNPASYSADVQWSALNLGSLQPLLPDLDALAGELVIDTEIVGSASGPRFDGTAQLRGGELRGLDLPTELHGARMDLTLQGQTADIDGGWRANAQSANESVALSGRVDWRTDPSLQLRVTGQSLPVDYPPWIRAEVDPDLNITVSAERVDVGGVLRVPRADIDIVAPESQPPTPSSDTVLVDDLDGVSDGDTAAMAIALDLTVELDDEVSLSGFGFDSRLQGAVDVRVPPGQPLQLFGNVSILDGRYQAWGQDLGIEFGEIVFTGPPSTAVVDATAWRELDTVRAGVAISGQVASPDVQVISEPPMPDQEALSYLVLGRAWDEAGDRQAAITRAALSLGLKRSGGITDRVAEGLGVQSLSVEAQGSGDDTSAVVNAQLNDKLSVQYGVGVFVPFRTLTARYQLGRQLYVEAVQGVESALDFFYSIDF